MTMRKKDLVAITLIILITMNEREYSCEASLQINPQPTTTQKDFLLNEMHQEKIDQMKIPKDQTLVVRLPSNTLLKYNSYKDVSILHFRIPPDTRRAIFIFKAIEEAKSSFHRKCTTRDVSLHLKASSYPVISPENISFPKNFLNAEQRFQVYNLQFQSNEIQHRITIEGPQVGNWFAVAFVSWTDPSNDRIEQQGLTASCDTLLLAEMSVSRFQPIIINNGQEHNSTLTSNRDEQNTTTCSNESNIINSRMQPENHHRLEEQQPQQLVLKNTNNSTLLEVNTNKKTTIKIDKTNATVPKIALITEKNTNITSSTITSNTASSSLKSKSCGKIKTNDRNSSIAKANNEIIYKFFVPRHIGVATARITFSHQCLQCPDIGFHVQPNAFPTTKADKCRENNYVHSSIMKANQTGEITIEFYVQPMTWHYALLEFVDENSLMDNSIVDHTPLEHQQSVKLPKQQDGSAAYLNAENEITMPFVIQFDYHKPLHGDTDPGENVHHNKSTEIRRKKYKSTTNQTEESAKSWDPKPFRGMEFYPLLRQTYREFFMYDYDLMPDENGTVPAVLNLTSGMPAGFTFDVGEVYDIGGTLSFAISMKLGNKPAKPETEKVMPSIPSTNERNGILAEKLIGSPEISSTTSTYGHSANGKLDDKYLARKNQTIIVCMRLGEPGEPIWPDKCRYGRHLLPASCVVNNTDSNTSTGLIHVPFPESGQWFISMGLYCHGAETASRATIIESVKEFVRKYAYMLENMRQPCACASKFPSYQECINNANCLAAMNETETLKIKECLMDSKCTSNHHEMTQKFEVHHKSATEQHFDLDNCSTSVVFTISSSPCVAGRCGRYGRCYHYMSGGFVFSTCVCMKGYRGWDCTEDSQVPSSLSILMASLLLTLSNLLFIPSIYIAGRRKYYTEAVIYCFAMFFSILYHACDSGEDEYSFCLVKIGVLQFCDFYCGLLAIWVTLVAMSHIRQQFVSLLHMLGAIMLAFGTELNKQSLWVFLAPALTGICLISVSWGIRCYKSRKWFPARRYLTVYMPLGTVLVMMGLVCYAFLQTKQNYHIVHSIWHMVMALSILCLLPSSKSFIPKC